MSAANHDIDGTIADWTRGTPGLAYQQCVACRYAFYFRRGFCPRCGAIDVPTQASQGRGVVYASTLVQRAPTAEYKALAPYCVVLVDLLEGLRVMAHGEPQLVIGDAVTCRFHEVAGRLLPYFDKTL